jgi:hypothetical protein
MVKHDIRVRGVDLTGTGHRHPVVVQMNDDDFPARFLQDLLTQGATPVTQSPISSAAVVTPGAQPLYQPVQRMLNVALMELECESVMYPPVDPTRVASAGIVVRRAVRVAGAMPNTTYDDPDTLAAWVKNAQGQSSWVPLQKGSATVDPDLDPDPKLRPALLSGQAETDRALAALALTSAYTESTTPAFAAPPATCAALGRTVLYGVIPTASSDVSDLTSWPPAITSAGLLSSLPGMLRSADPPIVPPGVPLDGLTLAQKTIDYRWLTDDFLNSVYPPSPAPSPSNGALVVNPIVPPFQAFLTSLRMLQAVFGVFTPQGQPIVDILNRHLVTFDPSLTPSTQGMGDFYQSAYQNLMNYQGYGDPGTTAPTLVMPDSWDWLNDQDQSDLLAAMLTALTPSTEKQSAPVPQGRFQDDSRWYRIRMFARVKGETPNCPTELVWSQYTKPFQIAAWYATGNRAHPPVPLPDLTPAFMATVKPNCSFQVPGNLMNAMQGTTLSGLMSGAGGGSGPSMGWICGFNIPLITICAFFVLNIFLILLNIVFFWLPFIKICIPFPSTSEPD